ncbi:hypothetical protein, partial [Actinomadura sp. LOL_011]
RDAASGVRAAPTAAITAAIALFTLTESLFHWLGRDHHHPTHPRTAPLTTLNYWTVLARG